MDRHVKRTILLAIAIDCLLATGAYAQTQCVSNALAGGTPNDITVPLLPCGLATNLLILTLTGENTGATTLQMVGFAPLPLVDAEGLPLAAGVLPGPGALALITGTGSQWRLLQLPGVQGPVGPVGPVGPAGSGVLPTVVVVDSGSTITPAASTEVLVVRKTASSPTSVVLPAASNWPDCAAGVVNSCPYVYVKDGKGDAASDPITVTAADGATIDNAASNVLAFAWQGAQYVLDPTGKWSVQ